MANDEQAEIAFKGGNPEGTDYVARRFRLLIENSTDIIVILDQNGVFQYCSPSAERVLGYRLQDVEGRQAAELVHPDDIHLILQVLHNAIRSPRISQPKIEYRVRHLNGSWRFFEAVATSLLDDPAIGGVVVNCHDITDRKKVEEALRAANRQIYNILESITDAFLSLDEEWRLTYWNQRATQLMRRTQEEVLKQNFWEIFPEFVGTILERECRRSLQQQLPATFEEFYPFLKTWFEVRIFPAAEGLSVFLVDVTERQQAQAELLEMSTALGNAVEGIARLDTAGRYIALNRAYAEALGYEQAEMIGLSWKQTILSDDLERMTAVYQEMLEEGTAEAEVRALRKDGSIFYKEVVMVAAYDWYDQFLGHHCFTRDITERKTAEAALLQQAERERQMAGLAKLSAGIAHRIRQSLNFEEILNTTVSEVRQFLNVDRVVIYRCHANSDRTVIAESVEPGCRSILGLTRQDVVLEQRHRAYHQGKPLVVDDVQQLTNSLQLQQVMRGLQVQAFLSVPILHGNQLWGMLVAHRCSNSRHWESYEIGLLEQLAIQVAIAIQQSELYEQVRRLNTNLEMQVQERTTQLEQALHYEAMLKRITDSVRDSLDEDQILQNAVQELALGLNVEGCDTAMYDLEQETSTIRYESIRPSIPAAKGACISLASYPEQYAQLLQGQFFQFCQNTPNSFRPFPQKTACLVCPIMDDQSVMGDLWLFKEAGEAFTDLEIRLVQQIANQCAIAIRQARLYQATQAQVTALEELNLLKDDFLSTVSHELRTPMSNMKMAIHMLQHITSPERQQQYLNILQAECMREIELINDLLDLQRLEASSYSLSPVAVDLHSCMIDLVESFQSRAHDRQQHLQVDISPHLPSITTDRNTLERIIAELLNNACKYTPPQGHILLHIQGHDAVSPLQTVGITITIRNQAEIPPTELLRIFDKFYRVPNGDRWKQGGTGLGLALVQRMVTELDGIIQATSDQGWTTFTVELSSLGSVFEPSKLDE